MNAIQIPPRVFPIVASEFELSPHESIRAEIDAINGRNIVRLSRWKITASGPCRTGQVFEFGAHRVGAIADLLAEVQRVLAPDLGGAHAAA